MLALCACPEGENHSDLHPQLGLQIVCRNCSRNKYPLKYLKDRMAKVCDGCYGELKKRGGDVPGLMRGKLGATLPCFQVAYDWFLKPVSLEAQNKSSPRGRTRGLNSYLGIISQNADSEEN